MRLRHLLTGLIALLLSPWVAAEVIGWVAGPPVTTVTPGAGPLGCPWWTPPVSYPQQTGDVPQQPYYIVNGNTYYGLDNAITAICTSMDYGGVPYTAGRSLAEFGRPNEMQCGCPDYCRANPQNSEIWWPHTGNIPGAAGQGCPSPSQPIPDSNPPMCHYPGSCDPGYAPQGNSCVLVDQSKAKCPSAECQVGYLGKGFLFWPDEKISEDFCANGCAMDSGNSNSIGFPRVVSGVSGTVWNGDWFGKGGVCSQDNVPPDTALDASKPPVHSTSPTVTDTSPTQNCFSDGTGHEFCSDRAHPGCGTIDGKSYCGDAFIPSGGGCKAFGSSSSVCWSDKPGGQPTPPPAVPGEPSPTPVGKVKVNCWSDDATWCQNNGGKNIEGVIWGYPGPSGNGNGDGDGTGTGGGDGNCPGCAQESTQKENKGLLTQIRDRLGKDNSSYKNLSDSKYFSESLDQFKGAMMGGPLGGILGAGFADGGGTCPVYTISIPFFNREFTLDGHCDLMQTIGSTLEAVMMGVWTISGILIVLGA